MNEKMKGTNILQKPIYIGHLKLSGRHESGAIESLFDAHLFGADSCLCKSPIS